jgi:hypothetical protein
MRCGGAPYRGSLRPFLTIDVGGMFSARVVGAYCTSPFRATSSPEAGRASTFSSVMSKVWYFRASGGTLSNTLVSPLPTLVNEPALMRPSPETNYIS